tara:strand:+ start:985 stop:1278 length:294 start_codon:yes stop_codon:yes gene_type:complete
MKLITVEELIQIKDHDSLFLIDVRESKEVASTPMENMPYIHIPMNDIPNRINEIDDEKQIVIFCHSGGRSAHVCEFLYTRGFENVFNLVGGITAWKK